MPIEFACESCSQLLRVPDGSGGQSCQCPACQEIVLIPDPQSIPQVELEPGVTSQTGTLTIACPKCRFELICSTNLLGTKGQCRNCQYIFTITDRSSESPVDSQVVPPSFVFNCPECDQLFEGQPEMEGRKGKCHVCGAVFAISLKAAEPNRLPNPSLSTQPAHRPLPSKPAVAKPKSLPSTQTAGQPQTTKSKTPSPTPRPVQTAGQTAGQPVVQTARPAARPATIQFACTHCQGVMEVPSSTAGRKTECPYCRQLLTIPQQSTVDVSAQSAPTNYYAPPTEAQPLMFPEPQNVVTSASINSNPYASPPVEQHSPYDSLNEGTSTTRKKIRGLTFSNAFELAFDSLLPYCLVGSAAFLLVGGIIFALVLGAVALAGFSIQSLQLDPQSTAGMSVVFGIVGVAVITSVFLVTAVFCMICNTALHVVRGRKISTHVLFGTGESYPGMLAIMLGWTVFNLLRREGIPWLVRSLADSGQMETAAVVGIVSVVVLFIVQVTLTFLLAFVPYALLDGQDLPNAIATSSSIFWGNFLTVFAVSVCGWLLFILVSVFTCGLGFIVFVGFMLYLNAAIYHLAAK